ncbi:hypothetical protein QCA50_001459 [Cerrena zonata]|uniref:Kinesin motor domain-containing protein n=1 Tax=Cerrena zonata TaxID=2478898 RepID=A0AAW0GUZ0_9APHY
MASKPKTATRASTRTKTPTSTTTTATRVTRAKATKTTEAAPKAAGRKPLAARENSPDLNPPSKSSQKALPLSKTASAVTIVDDSEREPIKAFLRIRPQIGDYDEPTSAPYLQTLSDTAVRMQDPSSSSQAHSRQSSVTVPSIYTFSHIFPPNTQQSDFFQKTTLPLVKDVLEGQSGLLFTYGVTNSGKTYTIQGGEAEGSAGILPRTLDVMFNSIEGRHGDGRCSRETDWRSFSGRHSGGPMIEDGEIDPTTLTLDRNYEYTIWLSYAEVYNEKAYDLFSSVDEDAQPARSGLPRPTSTFLNTPLPSSQAHPLILTRKALPVKPCPPSDNGDSSSDMSTSGRYIAGLRQIRVHSSQKLKPSQTRTAPPTSFRNFSQLAKVVVRMRLSPSKSFVYIEERETTLRVSKHRGLRWLIWLEVRGRNIRRLLGID